MTRNDIDLAYIEHMRDVQGDKAMSFSLFVKAVESIALRKYPEASSACDVWCLGRHPALTSAGSECSAIRCAVCR